MKIGLFACDHIASEYREQFGDYSDMYQRLFPEWEFTVYDVINGQFPQDLSACEVYMATGSKHSVYEDLDWIRQLLATIRQIQENGQYFIGYCFGHQALAQALGGKVGKVQTGWCVGVHTFEVFENPDWMIPAHDSFNLLMMCQDQVQQLPPHSQVLAGNERCPVGMFQVGERMLGIQAHPEFSKAYDRILMETRVARMGKKIVAEGMQSLQKTVHTQLIHDWVRNFLSSGPNT